MNKVYNGEISPEEAVSGQRKAEDTEIDWVGKPTAEQPDTAAAGMSAQTAPRADITDDGNFRMIDYGDTDTQRQLTQELHDQMVADGTVVQIESREDVAEHYPDLRGVKKQERNAILKGKIRELKQQLRSFLQTLRPNTYEFEVDGNVLEARIYDTAIREVTDRLTEAKSNMLYQSEEIFNNVRYLYSTPDYEGNPDIYRWNYFYTPVQIGDDVVGVRIAVRDMVESGESQIYHWGIKSDRPLAVRGRRNQSNPSVSSSGRSDNRVTQDSRIVNPSAVENSADTEIDRAGKPARTERKDEVTNGTGRTQSMYDDGGRDAGLDPGVEGRGVEAGGPQRTVDAGGKGSRAADRRADLRAERINDRIARFGGLTQDTTAAELIGSGDPESYLAVVPKNLYEEGMRRAAADAESMGASVTYVTGMLRVRGTDGEYHSADAVYDPQRRSIIAKADSIAFEGEQLVDHEVFHHLVKETPALVQQLADEIRQSFSEAEFNAIVERYMQVYRGATGGDLQKVQEEVLADAYAGMNRFRNFDATKYTDTVRGMTGQTDRSAIGRENAAAITRRGVGDDGQGVRLSYAGKRAKTADVQALRDAQAMDVIGADMESIRRATGWHKGRDGKWRFEIDDSTAEYRKQGDAKLLQEEGYRRLMELTDKWAASYVEGESALTEAEENEMEALEEEYSDRVWEEKYELQDFLKHEKLYEAYPMLRHAILQFEKLDEGTNGYYSAKNHAIVLSRELIGKPEKTLLHEIQHAIQKYEGFSGGSSPEYWARKDYENGTSISERLQKRYDDLLNGLSREEQNRYIRYMELERELGRLFLADENSEDGRKYARLETEQDKLYEELWPNEWFRKLLDLDRKIGNPSEEYYRMYRNSAGEIEARDSENRRALTAEQRRETAPDYGNEDTVFADGSNIGFSEEKNGIGLNSTDEERYEILKNTYLQPAAVDYEKLSGINLDDYNTRKKSSIEKGIKHIAELLGVTGANLTNRNVSFDFQYSKKSIGTSLHHQLEYGGTYQDYVKAMSCFDELIKNAVPIETHAEKKLGTSRANQDLKQVYVLLGAFKDDQQLIPVEFEIKEFYSADAGLYLTVTLTKIDTGVLEKTPTDVSVGDTSSLVPMSTYSLQSIIENVNPADGRFLKYIPDSFLSQAQLEAKRTAINKQNAEYAESGNTKCSLAKSEDTEELTAANNLSEADLREALISGAITLSDESDTGSISIVYPKGAEHPDGTVAVSDIQKVILPNYSALGIFRDLEDMGIPNEYYGTDGEYSREQLVNRALGREDRQTASEARQAAARRFDQERIDSLMRDAEQTEERRTDAERKAEEVRQKKIESMKNSPDAMRQRVGEALERYMTARRREDTEEYGFNKPLRSANTTLSPKEAIECLEAATGSPWVIKRRRDGTWKAVQQEGLAIGITMPREEALSRLENAKRGALSTPALQCGNKVYVEKTEPKFNKQLDFLIENRGHPILCVNLLYSENLLKC